MTTPLQQYLIEVQAKGLDPLLEIKDKKGIKTYRHKELPLVGFAYDQIDSPKLDPVVRWARGTVLEDKTWKLVAQSMPRFFNMGENRPEWDSFDWQNFVSTEKMDGSLLIVYHYNDKLMVNTSGSFGGKIAKSEVTFEEVFKSCVDVEKLDKNLTYVFELCTPYNKVVRNYTTPIARMITVFCGQNEFAHLEASKEALKVGILQVDTIKEIRQKSDLDYFLMAKESSDPTYEGVVIRDGNGVRFKCKTRTYLGFHHMHDDGAEGSYKRILPFIMAGECSEVKAYFPELTEKIDKGNEKYTSAINSLNDLFDKTKDITDQKQFAMAIKDHPLKSILFTMRKFGLTSKEDLRNTVRSHDQMVLKALFNE